MFNEYVQAIDDVGIRKPTHGNLEHWSRQGVLLLNTVLTVSQDQGLVASFSLAEHDTGASCSDVLASSVHLSSDHTGLFPSE